ncbi:TM2 domain-containing protein [Gracilimonas tropica]|uniref:TM2 domain-containing protein n=1 Tax=Gracilimonas tropica TaxID=454600 RepID=UPI00035D367A|nr:TM2 domain-containing protein [Gracilimonas tropica]
MRRSEEYEMALAAEQALKKAANTYAELINELEKDGDDSRTDLTVTIHDSIRNLTRKVEAYLQDKMTMEKVVEEFVFEYQVMEAELEYAKQESVRTRKFARKLLTSYEDFIAKVGGRKKLSIIRAKEEEPVGTKSKGKAYLFWFLGLFGILGLHRFYLGRVGTGIGWLLSGGVLGLGAVYDLFALSKMVEEQNMYNELRAAKLKQIAEKNN